jgi:hypothetical protein
MLIMGRIPRWPRFAVARGMNKGNCSFFARFARFSSASGSEAWVKCRLASGWHFLLALLASLLVAAKPGSNATHSDWPNGMFIFLSLCSLLFW